MSEAWTPSPDPTVRFSDRVSDYVRYRPSYPSDAIDAVFDGMSDAASLDVVDVGAGTGISTALLAARGASVIGIEPNANMRAAAAASGLRMRDGSAPATGLESGSCDIVCAFQAFHWFASRQTLEEFRRILRPGGRLALVWNQRDESDALTSGYGDVFDRARDREITRTFGFDWNGVLQLLDEAGWRDARKRVFANSQRCDLEGFLGRARSASYVPLEGPVHDRIIAELRALHARFADATGCASLRYHTDVYLAGRP